MKNFRKTLNLKEKTDMIVTMKSKEKRNEESYVSFIENLR